MRVESAGFEERHQDFEGLCVVGQQSVGSAQAEATGIAQFEDFVQVVLGASRIPSLNPEAAATGVATVPFPGDILGEHPGELQLGFLELSFGEQRIGALQRRPGWWWRWPTRTYSD
jgi:hypothetical protein